VFPATGLMKEWPAGGPELVWRYGNLGPSWASVAVGNETVYVPGGGSVGRLHAFSLEGELRWVRKYGREFSVRYQGARATPIVTRRFVVVTSGLAVIYCMDARSGKPVWTVDTVERFHNQVPGWGYNLTPLLVDGKLILPIRRGDCTAAALDLLTGETVWANEPSEYAIADSSPILVEHGRTRLVVNNLWNALIALDPDTGKIVWKREGEGEAGTMVTPVFHDGYLLLDYDRKTVMLRPTEDGQGFKQLWEMKRIASASQAVIVDGKVFTFGPFSPEYRGERGPGGRRAVALCCHDAETGRLLEEKPCPGDAGSVIAADGMVYWQCGGPRLVLARITPQGFENLSLFEPCWGGKEMWIHPVIAEGMLFYRSDCAQGGDRLKSSGKLAVYDLRADRAEELRERRRRIEALVKQLEAEEADERARAADLLAAMGFRARLAASPLAQALSDESHEVRRKTADALAAIGGEAVPALVDSLRLDRVWNDGYAARALVEATPGAEDLTAALIEVVQANPEVREDVASLLERVGPAATPALSKLLLSGDRHVRWWAINVLRKYGSGARAAVDNLITVLETGNQWFRANAARTLGAIGPTAAEAVPLLIGLTEDEAPDARAAAAEGLAGIGIRNRKVVSALERLASDEDDRVSAAAEKAMVELR
jgi:HEAT repeat protein/outer membrane protein assembly factor BamB